MGPFLEKVLLPKSPIRRILSLPAIIWFPWEASPPLSSSESTTQPFFDRLMNFTSKELGGYLSILVISAPVSKKVEVRKAIGLP